MSVIERNVVSFLQPLSFTHFLHAALTFTVRLDWQVQCLNNLGSMQRTDGGTHGKY